VCLLGLKPRSFGRPAHSVVTVATELSWFLYAVRFVKLTDTEYIMCVDSTTGKGKVASVLN
jgi:hypothetical protein